MEVPLSYYLTLSLVLFTVGALGVVVRRNAIVVFMCIELMLNAANIALVAFSKSNQNLDGQMMVLFVMVVAAAEAAIGLAIILSLFRARQSVETSKCRELKW
jgi:NADH-quinone oxidoreductase subunit K